ncbi:MAG: TRAP transporter substrate-binding protein [Lachnospiraceae bacterium]
MRKKALLAVAVLTVVCMAGCGQKQSASATQAAATETAKTEAAAETKAEEKKEESKADGKVYELRSSTNQAQTGTIGKALEFFCKTVEEKSGGRIKTTANFGNELGSQSEQVEMCKAGALELVLAAPGTGPGVWVPELQMYEFPFLFDSNAQYREITRAMEDEVNNRLSSYGFYTYGTMSMGSRDMLTAQPVTKLEDIKGLKMRGPNAVYISMFEHLGASGTTMDWNEVYTALQTKVMDGMEASPSMINSMKFQDNAKYLAVTNHCMACIEFYFNDSWFKGIPEDLQQIIKESVDATEAYQDALDDEDNEKALEVMKSEGVTVTEIEDLDKWVEACAPMLDEYRAKGENWNSFIDMIIEMKK